MTLTFFFFLRSGAHRKKKLLGLRWQFCSIYKILQTIHFEILTFGKKVKKDRRNNSGKQNFALFEIRNFYNCFRLVYFLNLRASLSPTHAPWERSSTKFKFCFFKIWNFYKCFRLFHFSNVRAPLFPTPASWGSSFPTFGKRWRKIDETIQQTNFCFFLKFEVFTIVSCFYNYVSI